MIKTKSLHQEPIGNMVWPTKNSGNLCASIKELPVLSKPIGQLDQ